MVDPTAFIHARTPDITPTSALAGIQAAQAGNAERRAQTEEDNKMQAKQLSAQAFQAWKTGNRGAFQSKIGELMTVDKAGAGKLVDIFGSLDRTNFVESAYHIYNAARSDSKKAQDKSIERAIDTLNVRPGHPMVKGLQDILKMPEGEQRDAAILTAVQVAKGWGAFPEMTKAEENRAKFQKTATFIVRDKEGKSSIVTAVFDPNTGGLDTESSEIPEGSTLVSKLGETAEENTLRKVSESSQKAEAAEAAKIGKDIYEQYQVVEDAIANYGEAITLIDKALQEKKFLGVGPIMKYVPKWTEASASLKNVHHRLGLNIVSSVTFGQLSNKELQLALDTALPTNLKGPELKNWLVEKQKSQEALRSYLQAAGQFIGSPKKGGGINTARDWMALAAEGVNRDAFRPAEEGSAITLEPGEQVYQDAKGDSVVERNGEWVYVKDGSPYTPK
jgi:hypothetical protein